MKLNNSINFRRDRNKTLEERKSALNQQAEDLNQKKIEETAYESKIIMTIQNIYKKCVRAEIP